MKRLNKKGFTLVELLAVVVILLAISVVAVSSISAAIDRNNAKRDKATEKILVGYAKLYADEYANTLDDDCVNVSELISTYKIDESTLVRAGEGGDFKNGSMVVSGSTFIYQDGSC